MTPEDRRLLEFTVAELDRIVASRDPDDPAVPQIQDLAFDIRRSLCSDQSGQRYDA